MGDIADVVHGFDADQSQHTNVKESDINLILLQELKYFSIFMDAAINLPNFILCLVFNI